MNMLFKNNRERKIRRCDKIMHKATIITVEIHQTNNQFYVTFQGNNACKLEFADHLWITFLDRTRSDIVFFAMITFHIYNILVTKRKSVIGANYIITFN